MVTLLFSISAYLLGAWSSAITVCRLLGYPDPRSTGSGNPGATNVARVATKKLALLVLLADLFKGLLVVVIAKYFCQNPIELSIISFAVIVGHTWPVYYRFNGGKGVATSFGVLLGLYWPLAITALCVWLLVFALTRLSSLSALIAGILLPVLGYGLAPDYLALVSVISILVIGLHHQNIRRLCTGCETKIS